MKNNFFKFILSMVLMFVAVSMVAQDFLTVYFKDGILRKFYLEGVTEITTSQYDAEGVQHTEYAYQHIVTRNKTYIYVLEDIDSITFTKYCEEEVKQAFSSTLSVAFPSLSPCETIEDAEQKIDIIKNADGVEDAWREGDDIYIKIKNWETISFHFHSYNKEQDNKELIRSLESLKRVVPQLIPQLRSGDGQGRMPSVVVANQMHYDKRRSDQKELLEALCKQLRDFGIDAHYEQDPKIEFFDTEMYKYDIVVLMTHGNYSNGQHSFVTVEELGDKSFKINLLDNSPAEDADYNIPSEEVKEAWRKAFNDLVDKKKYQGSSTVTLNYNKEFRGSVWPYYPHWIAHPQINEDFFEKKENGGLSEGKFRPNSIFFNGACHSMSGKDDAWHSLADKLIDNHGLSLYFGYENENYNSHEAACIFLRSMFNGMSTNNAFYSIPDFYRIEPEGAVLKIWPEIGTADMFLFQTHTNQVDHTKARNDFKNSKYVEVEGLATILDRNKSEALNAITYGFVYGTDERLASGEKATSKLTYGTYISSTDKMVLSSTIDKGNVLFKSKLTEIDPEKTYYYRAYTYDGIYYNYGIPCSFIINPPIRLNDGESYIIDDVAYTVRSKEKRTCQVGYGTNTVKPSARKRVGSDIVPAILPDREGVLSIPEEAGYLSVIAVGDYSFYDCNRLTAINLPETIEEIGESAMSGCIGLSSITIPKNVKAISRNAFGGCKNVKSIYAEMTNPFTINENVFQTAAEEQSGTASSIFANATLYVPVGSKNQYATTPGWNRFQRIDEYTPGGDNPDPSNNDDSIITFADAGVASICVERWDTNGDGMLSMDEAAAVTDLGDKFNYDITSFDELQYFTGLTRIGNYVFSGCIKLTSVTLPNTITTIGEQAFSDCSNLTSIIIPNSVTTIENCAFMCCTGLTNVTIPNSVTTIMSQAFDGCSSLYSLTIPNSATYIDDWAFRGCYGLNSVTFHCKAIKGWFMGNQSIREIVIGDEVTTIEDFAFEGCSGLVSVTIPHSVTNIGDNAFSGCNGLVTVTFHCDEIKCLYFGNSLKEVIIGDEVSSIGDYAFNNCTSLESVIIGNSVTSIGKSAFYGCINLTSLTIGNSVKSIGESAFYDCKGITSVTIPNSIETIGWLAFYGCNSLVSVTFHCEVINSWFGENNIKEIVIGDEVTSIGDYAFSGFTGLTSVTIPNSVTSIGQSAFHSCTGLTSVILPNSVITIGREAFYDCSSLTSLTIPNSVTSIGYGAFHGCTGLKEVYSYIEDPSSIGYNMFSFNLYDVILYVPAGTKALYEATVGWNRFPSIVEMGGETSR